ASGSTSRSEPGEIVAHRGYISVGPVPDNRSHGRGILADSTPKIAYRLSQIVSLLMIEPRVAAGAQHPSEWGLGTPALYREALCRRGVFRAGGLRIIRPGLSSEIGCQRLHLVVGKLGCDRSHDLVGAATRPVIPELSEKIKQVLAGDDRHLFDDRFSFCAMA